MLTSEVELFEGARETTNLADKSPEKVRALAVRLTHHLTSVGAEMPFDKAAGRAVPWPSEAAAGRQ